MSIKVNNQIVIDDIKKGTFNGLFVGQYSTGSEPVGPSTGDIIWNTTSSKIKIYDGTTWK